MPTSELQPARIGEELKVVELDGKRHFSVDGSQPLQLRGLVVDRNIDISIIPGGEIYTFISDCPGLMLSMERGRAEKIERILTPVVRFKIL